MSDNKRRRGAPDRRKVASGQDYEVRHVTEKFGVTRGRVRAAIRKVGNARRRVYYELRHGGR